MQESHAGVEQWSQHASFISDIAQSRRRAERLGIAAHCLRQPSPCWPTRQSALPALTGQNTPHISTHRSVMHARILRHACRRSCSVSTRRVLQVHGSDRSDNEASEVPLRRQETRVPAGCEECTAAVASLLRPPTSQQVECQVERAPNCANKGSRVSAKWLHRMMPSERPARLLFLSTTSAVAPSQPNFRASSKPAGLEIHLASQKRL